MTTVTTQQTLDGISDIQGLSNLAMQLSEFPLPIMKTERGKAALLTVQEMLMDTSKFIVEELKEI